MKVARGFFGKGLLMPESSQNSFKSSGYISATQSHNLNLKIWKDTTLKLKVSGYVQHSKSHTNQRSQNKEI